MRCQALHRALESVGQLRERLLLAQTLPDELGIPFIDMAIIIGRVFDVLGTGEHVRLPPIPDKGRIDNPAVSEMIVDVSPVKLNFQ